MSSEHFAVSAEDYEAFKRRMVSIHERVVPLSDGERAEMMRVTLVTFWGVPVIADPDLPRGDVVARGGADEFARCMFEDWLALHVVPPPGQTTRACACRSVRVASCERPGSSRLRKRRT